MKPCLTLSEGFLPLLLSYAVSAVCKPWRLLQGTRFPRGWQPHTRALSHVHVDWCVDRVVIFFFFYFFEVFSAHQKICIYTKYVFIARVCECEKKEGRQARPRMSQWPVSVLSQGPLGA